MKTHGNADWRSYPSYFNVAVPRILEFLDRRAMTISFFIVGKDAALSCNAGPLRDIASARHEIASHSFAHDPWLHLYSDAELELDLVMAEEAITAATGVHPAGFRGPGFSLSAATLELLAKRGYLYDATVFPNLLNPLARAYFFSKSQLSKEQKQQRKALFGSWTDARRPVKPFRWNLGHGELIEIPVTTMPFLRIPIHLSYLIYLAKYSVHAARSYFRFALHLCRISGTSPSVLLHPLDFLGAEDCPELRFFPGMDLAAQRKLALASELLALLADRYEIVTMREHVRRATDGGLQLPMMRPVFGA
jgi:peptidoglycan/xylan/chitin deacetylase (PgdA/CDA1 family)